MRAATRRATMAGAAVALATGPAAAMPDAALIALCHRYRDHWAESLRLCEQEAPLAVMDRRLTAGWALERRIVSARASTLAGFRAKASIAVERFDVLADGTVADDHRLAWSLCRDLLAAG